MNPALKYLYHQFVDDPERWDPFLAIFYLTYRCDFRCPYCSNGSGAPFYGLSREVLPGDAVMEILSRIRRSCDYVVITGGEPLLQLDAPLLEALHARGFRVAVETNGTQPVPAGVDWVCVSPKAGAPLAVGRGDELKLVFPQPGAEPERYEALDFTHFFLQPMDAPGRERNTAQAVAYCLEHPRWRLSLQTHKILGIP